MTTRPAVTMMESETLMVRRELCELNPEFGFSFRLYSLEGKGDAEVKGNHILEFALGLYLSIVELILIPLHLSFRSTRLAVLLQVSPRPPLLYHRKLKLCAKNSGRTLIICQHECVGELGRICTSTATPLFGSFCFHEIG